MASLHRAGQNTEGEFVCAGGRLAQWAHIPVVRIAHCDILQNAKGEQPAQRRFISITQTETNHLIVIEQGLNVHSHTLAYAAEPCVKLPVELQNTIGTCDRGL